MRRKKRRIIFALVCFQLVCFIFAAFGVEPVLAAASGQVETLANHKVIVTANRDGNGNPPQTGDAFPAIYWVLLGCCLYILVYGIVISKKIKHLHI